MVEDKGSENDCLYATFYFPNSDLLALSEDKSRDRYGFDLPYPLINMKEFETFYAQYTLKVQFREKRWNSLMGLGGTTPPSRSSKVQRYISKGIPTRLRPIIWFHYSGAETKWLGNQGLYKHLMSKVIELPDLGKFAAEINQDLHRTFPNNINFKTKPNGTYSLGFDPRTRPILAALRRVLLCFSLYRPEVGYQQSFSYIVGILLLFMDEERAFFMLCFIVENLMKPELYRKGDKGSTNMVRVMLMIIKNKQSKLWAHLIQMEKAGMPSPGLAIAHWFPLLFADLLPIESNLRLWDSLFYEGEKMLYRVALAVFKIYEKEVLSVTNPLELFQLIQNLPKKCYNCQLLMETAFSDECSISDKKLARYYDAALQLG